MRFKLLTLAVMATGLAFGATTADLWPGATWYVDDDNYGKSGMDGTTPATAFGSLQEANDAAAVKAGDIIKVLPGLYNQGDGSTHTENAYPSRLVVTKKLRFEAEKGTVRVEGRLSANANHIGADGMRCVYVASTAAGAELHGMMFCNASASTGNGGGGSGKGDSEGGGICVYGSRSFDPASEAFAGAFIVDCVVSNCWGQWSGGIRGGTSIRTLVIDCGGTSFGQSVGEGALWNCMIVNSTAYQADRPTVGNRARFVNCTFYQCGSYGSGGYSRGFNSVYCSRTGSVDYNDNVIGVYPASEHKNCYGKLDEPRPLFAPALGDYRVLAGSKADGAREDGGGLTKYLTEEIRLPADTEMTDFYGNPLDLTKEKCAAGACQETVTPTTGWIEIPAGYTVEGHYAKAATYAYSETFPNTMVIRPIKAKHFRFRLGKTDTNPNNFFGDSVFRYVQEDGFLHLPYPPFPKDRTAFSEDVISLELWTDPNADAASADGTEAHPFRTLQAAMDYLTANNMTSSNTVVHAKPGDYHEGGAVANGLMSRVVIPDGAILLKSTGGAAVTTIRGASDPNAPKDYFPGCGPNAVRCVTVLTPSGSNRMIQGFTLADGRSGYVDYSSAPADESGGGVSMSVQSSNIQIHDCVYTNCSAVRCGAAIGPWQTRCAFYDCHGFGGVMRNTVLAGCYVDASCSIGSGPPTGGSPNAVLGTETKSYLTTAIGASYTSGDSSKIWHASDLGLNSLTSGYRLWGTVAPLGTWTGTAVIGGRTAEICAVDGDHGDWRLMTGSVTTTAGLVPSPDDADYGRWRTNLAAFVSSGIDGSKLTVIDGHIVPGCYQKTADGVTVVASNGGLAISGGKFGFNEVSDDLSIVLSADPSARRNCLGVALNGVTNLFVQTPTVTVGPAEIAAARGALAVEAVYGTDWYVNPDPSVGNDANDGFTSETPKRTLAGVMAMDVRAGDTVHAAAGEYRDGTMSFIGDRGFESLSRVIVPVGVTLVGEEGAGKTFIFGEPSTAADADSLGRGTGAARCVTLGTGAKVKGFTLTGGRTLGGDFNDWSNKSEALGAGVYANESGYDKVSSTLVENCVISNCVAMQGGAGWNATFVDSRIFFCRATRGAATEQCGLVGTIVDEIDCDGSTGLCVVNWYKMLNSTIGRQMRKTSGGLGTAFYRSWTQNYGVTNTLVLAYAYGVVNACNSAFRSLPAGSVDCITVNADAPGLDAEYRPIIGMCPAVDKGLNAAVVQESDLLGGQRIYNGRVDIGAVEADWRARYAADISGRRRFVVTDATPNVTETADATVSVGAGGSLAAVWKGVAGKAIDYTVSVKVSGTGVAKIGLGTDVREVSPSADVQTLTFTGAEAANRLVCDNSGNDGAVEILGSKRILGALLIVR